MMIVRVVLLGQDLNGQYVGDTFEREDSIGQLRVFSDIHVVFTEMLCVVTGPFS